MCLFQKGKKKRYLFGLIGIGFFFSVSLIIFVAKLCLYSLLFEIFSQRNTLFPRWTPACLLSVYYPCYRLLFGHGQKGLWRDTLVQGEDHRERTRSQISLEEAKTRKKVIVRYGNCFCHLSKLMLGFEHFKDFPWQV